MTPGRISVALLLAALVAGAIAWSLQSEAATALEAAVRVQSAQVPESDTAPPTLSDNRKILRVLSTSIGIRKRIDSLLSDVEGAVTSLRKRQAASLELAGSGRGELRTIARALGGAAGASRTSVRRLGDLRGQLATSARIAARIARELRELDHKLGPTAGSGR